jgi:5-methylcytosine-specific restriction endonuclease McrA
MRRWRQGHPAEHAAQGRSYYERHKERLAAYFAQYRREHRDVRQRADARRHARKLGAPGAHTTVEWIWLLQVWNWTCAYCGKAGVALQPDHRIPLALGGSNAIDNILPACPSCNQRKGLMNEDEFRARLAREQILRPPEL